MVCLGNKQRSFCCLRLHLSTAVWTLFFDYDGYSISSKGFMPTVVDIMVIGVKFTHSSPFYFTDSQNIHGHSCHLLFDHFQFALIHGLNIPGFYAILLFTVLDFTHQSHPQLGVVFALAPSLHSFWSYFSTDLKQYIGYLPTWGVHLSVSYLFCLFILLMGFSRQEY